MNTSKILNRRVVMRDAAILISFIQATYKGGMEQFMNDRGAVIYLPPPADFALVIVTDDMPTEFVHGIKKNFPTVSIEKGMNFEDAPQEEMDDISAAFESIFAITELDYAFVNSPAALIISFKTISKENKAIEAMGEALSNFPGLIRAFIVCKDGYLRVDGDMKEQVVIASIVKATDTTDKPKRACPIDAIDIGVLQQALAKDDLTIDELIASM
jgi:hypothetical protein